jgi:uncharacterized protein YcfJ
MNKLLATIAIIGAVGFALPAIAGNDYATITSVTPNYENFQVQRHRLHCSIVDVPIYGSGGQASTGDTVFGALIGGAIGNQVGGGKGKDAMTVLGAIIGADVANKRAVTNGNIIAYRSEESCKKIMFHETQERLRNYTIEYKWNGINGRAYTNNEYRIGDRLPITVSIQAD